MNHNDYSSALLAQIRNSVRDVNTIAAAETFEFFESCIPVSAVKTFSRVTLTGCGDSYHAGFVCEHLIHGDIAEAMKKGSELAAETLGHYGGF